MNGDAPPAPNRPSHRPASASTADRAGGETSPRPERTWQLLLIGGLLLTLLYIVLPYGTVASALYVGMTLGAAVLVAAAVYHRERLFSPAAWILLACGLAVTTVGHFTWYWLDLRGLQPFPSIADAFYLGAYPMFIGALWMLGRRRRRDAGPLVDALIVGIAAAVLGWTLLITPYVRDPGLTMVQLVVSAAYPVADLILLPLILRLLFEFRAGIRAHQFLLVGMVAYLAADVLYAHGTSTGWYVPGGFTDGLWLVGYTLFVSAAWHPTASLEPEIRPWYGDLSGRRLALLGAASVFVPAVILVTAATEVHVVRVAAVASILLLILVMLRLGGLMRRVRRQAEELEGFARRDPLTGAANRRTLDEVLEREIARVRRTHSPLCVAFFDLDHFKRYNDTHGHAAGDALLRDLVAAWRGVLRPTDLLARVGGEEFLFVFPHTAQEECRAVVERLRALVPYGQTCSAGMTLYRPGETAGDCTRRADQALYEAKNRGRDRAVLAERGESGEDILVS
ncbi:MAG: GGDEF domain-containing protein [Halofilum sp. (in: g-proteobacteria)]|nr:GGDEF domain-containing protein [Halofilum sp. (in: g-proteobacteria)]